MFPLNFRIIFLLFLVFYSLPAYAQYSYKTILSNNLKRIYRIYLPQSFSLNEHLPVVIVLHGGGSSGKRMSNYIKLHSVADKNRFIAVFPDGVRGNWNDGRKNIDSYAHLNNINDVMFISDIISNLQKEFNIDSNSVFITGISNGSLMAFRLAFEIPGKIRAIATVAGNLPHELKNFTLDKKLPLLMINGENDPVMPWNGGGIGWGFPKRGNVLSSEETFTFWSKENGCNEHGKYTQEADISNDGTKVFKKEALNCPGNIEVLLYKIQNGGHSWPGAFEYLLQERFVGKTSYDIDAKEIIWTFFKKYIKPLPKIK